MATKAAEPIDLPPPVSAYFAADTTGAEAVAQCFTDGAVVIDERQEYGAVRPSAMEGRGVREVPLLGRAARRPRLRGPGYGDRPSHGRLPGQPRRLQYRFTLEGEIARLEIAP